MIKAAKYNRFVCIIHCLTYLLKSENGKWAIFPPVVISFSRKKRNHPRKQAREIGNIEIFWGGDGKSHHHDLYHTFRHVNGSRGRSYLYSSIYLLLLFIFLAHFCQMSLIFRDLPYSFGINITWGVQNRCQQVHLLFAVFKTKTYEINPSKHAAAHWT